jgi:hypothetical protein
MEDVARQGQGDVGDHVMTIRGQGRGPQVYEKFGRRQGGGRFAAMPTTRAGPTPMKAAKKETKDKRKSA